MLQGKSVSLQYDAHYEMKFIFPFRLVASLGSLALCIRARVADTTPRKLGLQKDSSICDKMNDNMLWKWQQSVSSTICSLLIILAFQYIDSTIISDLLSRPQPSQWCTSMVSDIFALQIRDALQEIEACRMSHFGNFAQKWT